MLQGRSEPRRTNKGLCRERRSHGGRRSPYPAPKGNDQNDKCEREHSETEVEKVAGVGSKAARTPRPAACHRQWQSHQDDHDYEDGDQENLHQARISQSGR